MTPLSRRQTLQTALGLATAGLGLSIIPLPATAKAPLAGAAALGINRIKIGAIEVTALADGYLDITPETFSGADAPTMQKLLQASFRPAGPHRSSVNAYVVNTGDRLVLIDSGTIEGFAPTLAKFHAAFAAAGFDAAAVDVILPTHYHPDHVGGLAREGKALFANAELVAHETEHKFWTDESLLGKVPDGFKPFVVAAQAAVKPYAARTRLFKGGADVLPGITAVELFGHSPGHTGYRISSGNQSLLIWGDIIHAPGMQFAEPKITLNFDQDQNQARETRLKILDQVAADRTLVTGAHHDFPGFGFIAKAGSAYAFTPAPYGYGI